MDLDTPIVVGESTACGVHDSEAFVFRRSEFVEGADLDVNHRVVAPAGRVLFFVDYTVPRALFYFIFGYPCPADYSMPDGISMSTISFNCSLFHAPTYNGDLLLTETRVIHIGASSAGLHTLVMRQSFDEPQPVVLSEYYTTMVIIDAANPLQARKGCLPAVRLTTQEGRRRHELYGVLKYQASAIKKMYKAAAVVPPPLPSSGSPSAASPTGPMDGATAELLHDVLHWSSIELDVNKAKQTYRTPQSTSVLVDRTFSPAVCNVNQTIFGGEILRMMDLTATHCARVFCGKAHVSLIAMLDMVFEKSIILSDLGLFRASVTCVGESILVVDVVAQRQRQSACETGARATAPIETAARACMVLACTDATGKRDSIATGLDLSCSSQLELVNYSVGCRLIKFAEEQTRNGAIASVTTSTTTKVGVSP